MRYTNQYISDMISCAESKLAAASAVAWRREYYGVYGLTDSIWHINQLKLYLFLLRRWNNSPLATNASTEEDLSHIFDRIIRMPYPCDLQSEPVQTTTTNRPPIVNAGVDQSLATGITSTTLAGTATDPDGDTVTVVWSKISGGNVTINSQTSLITSLTNMQPGVYIFRLTATDSTGLSAYDEMTITIAQALDTIYYGRNDNPFPGVGQEAYILAGSSLQANGALDVDIPWHTGSTGPQYCWVAIPNLSAAHNKNKWFVDIINQGSMGATTDLFGAPQTVSVLGVDYLVWETNYQTQFAQICTLKKV
jgi:hypothetical protein